VHYCQKGNQSSLAPLSVTDGDQAHRKICVTRVSNKGSTVLSLSSYDENKSRGSITLRYLAENLEGGSLGSSVRTGFTEPLSNQQKLVLKKAKSKTKALPATTKSIAKYSAVEPTQTKPVPMKALPATTKSIAKSSAVAPTQTKPVPMKALPATKKSIAKSAVVAPTKIKPVPMKALPATTKSIAKTSAVAPTQIKPVPMKALPATTKSIAKSPVVATQIKPVPMKALSVTTKTVAKSAVVAPTQIKPVPTKAHSNEISVDLATPIKRSKLVIPGDVIKIKDKTEKEIKAKNLLITPDPKNRKRSPLAKRSTQSSTQRSSPDQRSAMLIEEQSPVSKKPASASSTSIVQSQPIGVAVSPEQPKKTDETTSAKPEIDPTQRCISKFFKNADESNKTPPKTKVLKPKKVKFQKVKAVTMVRPTQMDASRQIEKKRSLRESKFIFYSRESVRSNCNLLAHHSDSATVDVVTAFDVVTALCELRKIASVAKRTTIVHLLPDAEVSEAKNKATQELDEYLATFHKRKRPKFTRETDLTSVFERMTPFYQKAGTVFVKDNGDDSNTHLDMDQSHCMARRQLAVHHRASHERLRSMVISSADRIMNVASSQSDTMNYTKSELIEFARQTITETICNHQEALVSVCRNVDYILSENNTNDCFPCKE